MSSVIYLFAILLRKDHPFIVWINLKKNLKISNKNNNLLNMMPHDVIQLSGGLQEDAVNSSPTRAAQWVPS